MALLHLVLACYLSIFKSIQPRTVDPCAMLTHHSHIGTTAQNLRRGAQYGSFSRVYCGEGLDAAQQFVDADFTQGFGIHFFHNDRAVQAVFTIAGRQVA